jgi:hypothetical protein
MIKAIDECRRTSIDNLTIDDLPAIVRIAKDHEPERMAAAIRERAEKQCRATMIENGVSRKAGRCRF